VGSISYAQKTKIFPKTKQRPQQVRSLSVLGTFFTVHFCIIFKN